MQNPCRRQAIIITLGANATTCRRQAIYVYWYPFLCPPYAKRTPIPRQRLIRRRRISLKRDNHPPLVKQKKKGKICFVIHIAGEKKIIILHLLRDCEAKIYKRSSNHYSHTHTHTHTRSRARARTHTHTCVHTYNDRGAGLAYPWAATHDALLYSGQCVGLAAPLLHLVHGSRGLVCGECDHALLGTRALHHHV
jgi:hypothetical protein